jgi:hypothetical protein
VKKISIALGLALSLSFAAFAQDAAVLSLKDNMKQTGAILKQIAASVNDASKNAANADLTAKMIAFFESAKTQRPDSVTAGSIEDYQSLIGQEIQNMKDLQAAFQKNDNVGALAVIQKMNTLKKEGHDKYK